MDIAFFNAQSNDKLVYSLLFKLALICVCFTSPISHARQTSISPNFAYIALDPDIVTNYAGDNSKKLGYLRVTVEIMLDNPDYIMEIERHMPLLRATAIEIIGAQSEQKVRSLTGREEMRREIMNKFRGLLLRETGKEIVKDIIFTKYLRQGG